MPHSAVRPQRFWSIEYGERLLTSSGSPRSSAKAIALSRVMPLSRTGAMHRQLGGERLDADLEPHLVVALAGAAVADRVGVERPRGVDEVADDQRPGQRGDQRIAVHVERVGVHRRDDEVAGELLPGVDDDRLDRAAGEGALPDASRGPRRPGRRRWRRRRPRRRSPRRSSRWRPRCPDRRSRPARRAACGRRRCGLAGGRLRAATTLWSRLTRELLDLRSAWCGLVVLALGQVMSRLRCRWRSVGAVRVSRVVGPRRPRCRRPARDRRPGARRRCGPAPRRSRAAARRARPPPRSPDRPSSVRQTSRTVSSPATVPATSASSAASSELREQVRAAGRGAQDDGGAGGLGGEQQLLEPASRAWARAAAPAGPLRAVRRARRPARRPRSGP